MNDSASTRWRRWAMLGLLVPLLWCARAAEAGAPSLLNYQGVLTLSDGTAIQPGPYDLRFRIYDLASGGTLKFEQTLHVNVADGLYNVLLSNSGAQVGTLDSAFDTANGEQRYMEVKIVSGAGVPVLGITLSPRQQIASVPYALVARSADTASSAGHADNGLPLAADEPWTTPTLAAPWVANGPPYYAPGYRKNRLGRVQLRGTAASGSNDSVIFTLPLGYRPSGREYRISAAYQGGLAPGQCHILPNGEVRAFLQSSGVATYFSIDGVEFDPAP